MSQYINFYIKKHDEWIMIGEYSNSTKHFEMIGETMECGKLVPLDKNLVRENIDRIDEAIRNMRNHRKNSFRTIDAIIAMKDSSIEEKLDHIGDYRGSIEWADDEIRQLIGVKWFCRFLLDLIDLGEYYEKESEYVWAGIEAFPPKEEGNAPDSE